MKFRKGVFLGFVASGSAAAPDDWSTLPWTALEDLLSPSATLFKSADPVSTYKEECLPEFQKPFMERTNHNLINQPSGLCTDQLYCSFKQCVPSEEFMSPTEIFETVDMTGPPILIAGAKGENMPVNKTQFDIWIQSDNTAWNLPSYVLHPVFVGDVVAAIAFAKEHGLEVSVKNSGHSYQGASTKSDSLHINMNKYKQYSNEEHGIHVCSGDIDLHTVTAISRRLSQPLSQPFEASLGDQPCRLAKARGKNAYLRTGGGENFDKVYRSVIAYNKGQSDDTQKVHLVGGGAGTVSPMGWTFQGGLSDQMGASLHGLGVDQVLRIDAVLPSGQHVRFGPTMWDVDDDYYYPKTLQVTGACNQNPFEEEESNWIWSECEGNINFNDLWFAMLGGGGGTWGVVTSMVLQLHEYRPLEMVTVQACIPDELKPRTFLGAPYASPLFDEGFGLKYVDNPLIDLQNFTLDFLLNPDVLGVSDDEALSCSGLNYCYGEGTSEIALRAWKNYITQRTPALIQAGVNSTTIESLASCAEQVTMMDNYPSTMMIPTGPNAGKVSDAPYPSYESGGAAMNILVPATYYLENREESMVQFPLYYGTFRSRTKFTSDQANALSEAHREAGNMAVTGPIEFYDDVFWSTIFPKVFDTSDPDQFPGFLGSNHAGAHVRGPLKDDWTKACPLDWTNEERNEKCIPLQECIYGTKRLRRLEAIKEAIDPTYMFDCIGCIGNNRVKGPAEALPDFSSHDVHTDSGSSVPMIGVTTMFIIWLSFSNNLE